MYTISVQYNETDRASQKSYDYLYDKELPVGSYAVVEGGWEHDGPKYKVVTVTANSDLISEKATKWIVDHIDDTEYQARLERAERAKVVKADLDRRIKELAEIRKYEILKSDPAAAALLSELEELSK